MTRVDEHDSSGSPGAAVALAEWAVLPDECREELVDGRLVERPMPDALHGLAVLWLARLLADWAGPRGFVLPELRIALDEGTGRQPDVSVYLETDVPPPPRALTRSRPSIVVEVVSPTPDGGRRDRIDKVDDYAAFGIPWYWIVDPSLRSVEIFERDAMGRYVRALGVVRGVVADVPGCPGLTLDLDALWAELDRLDVPTTQGG